MLTYLEARKILSNKSLWKALMILFFLNLITSYIVYSGNSDSGLTYSPKAYREAYGEIQGLSFEEAKAYIETKRLAPERVNDVRYSRMWEDIQNEVYQAGGYPLYLQDYLREIDALSRERIYDFASPGEKLHLTNMKRDIGNWTQRDTKIGGSKGWERLFNSSWTDIYMIFGCIGICFILIIYERQTGQLALYKTSKNGHAGLAISKCIVACGLVSLLLVLFTITNLTLVGIFYGLGDIHRPIQSVVGYGLCRYSLSIIEFVITDVCFRMVAYFSITLCLMILAYIGESFLEIYIEGIIFIGLNLLLYYGIALNHKWVILHYLNLCSSVFAHKVIGNYCDVFLFGRCIPAEYCMILLLLLVFVLSIVGFIFIFAKREYGFEASGLTGKGIRLHMGCGLFRHEWVKFSYDGRNLILMLALLGYGIYILNQPVNKLYYIPINPFEHAYMDYLAGEVSEEKIHYLDEEIERFQGMNEMDLESATSRLEALTQIRQIKTPYLQECGGEYVMDTGYRLLTMDGSITGGRYIKLGILALLFMSYSLFTLYQYDSRYGTVQMLTSCIKGRGHRRRNQLLVGIIYVSLVYAVIYGCNAYIIFKEYGFKSFDAPACSMQHLSMLPNWISIGEYFVAMVICQYLIYIGLLFVCSRIFEAKKAANDL